MKTTTYKIESSLPPFLSRTESMLFPEYPPCPFRHPTQYLLNSPRDLVLEREPIIVSRHTGATSGDVIAAASQNVHYVEGQRQDGAVSSSKHTPTH
jgi:hypothetical protein